MAYLTLQDKIEALANSSEEEPIPLPIEMLTAVTGGTPLAYIVDTAPHSAKDLLDSYTLENVTGFFVSFRWENNQIRRYCYVTFSTSRKKVHVHMDEADFFNLELVDKLWNEEYLPSLRPGDLAICVYPKVYLIEDLGELMEGGYERAKWDHVLGEGSLLTIMETNKIDKYPFIKVIYKGRIYWSFGALARLDKFQPEEASHNHHFI